MKAVEDTINPKLLAQAAVLECTVSDAASLCEQIEAEEEGDTADFEALSTALEKTMADAKTSNQVQYIVLKIIG